jgi:choline dehydrogenase-like flavoprotein
MIKVPRPAGSPKQAFDVVIVGGGSAGAVLAARLSVDARGKVRGLQALRVVDASILPEIPSVPTNVTTIMVAERIAAKLSA